LSFQANHPKYGKIVCTWVILDETTATPNAALTNPVTSVASVFADSSATMKVEAYDPVVTEIAGEAEVDVEELVMPGNFPTASTFDLAPEVLAKFNSTVEFVRRLIPRPVLSGHPATMPGKFVSSLKRKSESLSIIAFLLSLVLTFFFFCTTDSFEECEWDDEENVNGRTIKKRCSTEALRVASELKTLVSQARRDARHHLQTQSAINRKFKALPGSFPRKFRFLSPRFGIKHHSLACATTSTDSHLPVSLSSRFLSLAQTHLIKVLLLLLRRTIVTTTLPRLHLLPYLLYDPTFS